VSYVGVVKRLWLFQFVTAPFVHASLTHVAFNMLTLSWLGPDIERRLGCLHYLMFSAVCALVSLAGFLWWSLGTGFVGCGYSGVIFGLLVAAATFTPDRTVWIYAFFPLRMRVAVLVLGVVELYFTLVPAQGGHVANVAHLFGGAAGWAYLRWGVGRPRLVRSPIPLAPPAGSPRQRGKGGPGIPWEL
jgi:membrane associated rhomboid family serine protease